MVNSGSDVTRTISEVLNMRVMFPNNAQFKVPSVGGKGWVMKYQSDTEYLVEGRILDAMLKSGCGYIDLDNPPPPLPPEPEPAPEPEVVGGVKEIEYPEEIEDEPKTPDPFGDF